MKRYIFLQDPILHYEVDEQPTIQEIHSRLSKGIPYSSFEDLAEHLPLTNKEWAMVLGVSDRTLQRWFNDHPRIDGLTAERVFELARLTVIALDVFHSGKVFADWLRTAHPDFDGETPFSIMQSHAGIELVKSLLLRLMHGVVV
ncbi:MAG: hypothetical protein RL177_1231 [Bacteroidota bacterium]|jgi:putative toxin-antitoxin system antitoxin component (TIGR02293 family)